MHAADRHSMEQMKKVPGKQYTIQFNLHKVSKVAKLIPAAKLVVSYHRWEEGGQVVTGRSTWGTCGSDFQQQPTPWSHADCIDRLIL